jgi:hypothetical protein
MGSGTGPPTPEKTVEVSRTGCHAAQAAITKFGCKALRQKTYKNPLTVAPSLFPILWL